MIHYGLLIRTLHSCFSHAVTNGLAQLELTSAQGHIMRYLARCQEPPCPKDVEEMFQLSHPTVSGLLARLEKKEFIRMLPDPNDRRCKRIHICAKGYECSEKMHQQMIEDETRVVQGFTEAEKEQFADLLTRAIRNMGGEPHIVTSKEETDQ